ncbi:MAG: hypothetical protein ACYC7E_17525 [Armatimonadota bacterium]
MRRRLVLPPTPSGFTLNGWGGVNSLDTRLKRLFKYLDVPREDLPYVLNRRPDPLPGETEFPREDTPVWPVEALLGIGMLCVLQQVFLKYPCFRMFRKAALYGNTMDLYPEAIIPPDPPRLDSPRYQYHLLARQSFRQYRFAGISYAILGMGAFLTVAFTGVWYALHSKSNGLIPVIAIGSFIFVFIAGYLLYYGRSLATIAKPEMRRQVLRYLAWAKARAAQGAAEAPAPVQVQDSTTLQAAASFREKRW